MKELPQSEQPYEVCARDGAAALSDAQLLAILIRSGTKERNSLELAIEILKECGEDGLAGMRDMSLARLKQLAGIGKVKGIQILAACELGRRMQLPKEEQPVFSSPEAIARYYIPRLKDKEQEEMHLLFLDTKNRRIQDELLTRGTVNASLVSTRELFMEALRHRAVRVVMIHNHPSGDPSPSKEDISTTRKVKSAGELLDIMLIDHIVVGGQQYVSLKELGYL